MLRVNILVLSLSLLFFGCASKSTEISPSYVSPTVYSTYDCDSLTIEYSRLIQQSENINRQQDEIASSDETATAIGFVVWPAFFFIDSDDMEEEVATLKGELVALEQASILKKCETLSIQIESDRVLSKKAIEELQRTGK